MWDVTKLYTEPSPSFFISTHTSRVGCDLVIYHSPYNQSISTHTSRVGCDVGQSGTNFLRKISTHTSRVGCDGIMSYMAVATENISTHTSRVGCDDTDGSKRYYWGISTHTSRVGCDNYAAEAKAIKEISTHTSRVGCDDMPCGLPVLHVIFLLTHPVWDVTAIYSIFQSHYSHILQDGPIIHLELY